MKKQLFLFLCTLFSIVAGVQKVQAYTVENLVEDGWTLVNSESVTGVDDNVYVLVDAYSSAYVMSAEADHFRPCYKSIDSPLGHPSFVWNLEGSDNSFALKSVATGAYFKQADGWNTSVGYSRDNRNKATCTFTLNGGKYDLKCNESNAMVGHWNDGTSGVANDGEDIAANKSAEHADGFFLYAKPKADYIAALAAARKEAAAGASKESPVEVTSWIQNADFSGDWGGWECTFSSSGNMQWGQKTLESWNAGNVLIKQTLSGVPDGLYRLTADVISGNNDNKTAYVFATGAGESKSSTVSAVASAGNYGTMSAEVAGKTLTADNCLVTNGVLTVGINQPSGWIVADNFKLWYMGEDMSIYVEAYNSAKAAAEAIDQTAPMNAGALAALQQALTDYSTVDETSKSALQEAAGALGTAASNASASITAYSGVSAVISAANDIKTNHNFATAEAIETFTSAIAAVSDGFEAGTLTNEEAANAGTTLGTVISGWRGNAAGAASKYLSNGFGLNGFDAALYVNTWSNEGESDGSNFKVPFYEYWTGDANSLGANTWTGTIDVPNGQYKISALVRVRAKNGVAAADANGITMTVTDGDAVDVTEGTQVGESQFQLKEYEAVGLVKDGKLIFNMVIAADNNISWLSFKNVKYEKLRDLTPEESAIVPADLVLDATKTVFRAKAVTLTPTSSTEGASIEGYTTWESDNTDVATVDANGVVTGVGYGTANITVTSTLNASATATCAVTVDAPAVAELENTDFTDGPVVAAHIRTYAKDKTGTDVAQMQPVSGWAMAVANGDARAAGVMAYGSAYGMGSDNADFFAPATNPEGEASGNALGMVGVWTGSVQYVQYVKLAPGAYTVTVPVYRNGGASALTKNLIGVILDDNTEYLAKTTTYAANEWTTEKITFAVESETYAKLSVGLNAPNVGSASSQRLWIDGFKIECEPFATDEEYAALNAAIEAAEAKNLGFEEGEYAPYNNVEACAALANAKAVSSGKGSSSAVVAATTALTDAAWTANTEEVNAVFDGSFEYDYRATTPSGNINPIGWRQTSTSGENATNVRYMDGSNAGLAATTSGKALFAKFSSYYGYVENYQMPLKANTLYRISFVYGGWGDCKKDGYVQVLGPDGTSVELSASELPLDAVDADANADSWKEYTAVFRTNEAGNYVLGFLRTQATQSQYVFGDIVLKKVQTYAITVNPSENGTVVADKAEAAEGETVTLTATPAANYQFAGAYYMLNEEKVDITIDGNTASFAMPAAAVNVIATFGQKTDFTDRIVNANLTGTDPEGFDVTGTKGIDGSGIVKAGNNAQFDFKQTVSLPAGRYKLTAQAAYRFGGSEADEAAAIVNGETTKFASLYATIGEKTVSTLVQNRYDGASETDYAAGSGSVVVNEKYVPNSSAAVQAWFNAGQYVNELVFNLSADGDVTIGIAKDAQPAVGDYTVIGPWTLTRLGDAQPEYAITVAPAENGNVVADKVTAAAGETVKVTATPDEGYMVDYGYYVYNETQYDFESIDMEHNIATFTMPAGPVSVVLAFKQAKVAYQFVPSEWGAGDAGRISPENVVADDAAGTITVNKSGANNVCLLFRSAKTYEVKAEQRYFVIKATGLSTAEAASYLWWLNNTNDGSQIAPTSIFEENGQTVFAWDCVTIPIGGKLGIEDTEFTDQGGWSTTFGMTLSDDAVPAVISYIGFQETIPEPVEELAYEFVPSEWGAGDAGRISPENVVADDDMGTITVDKTGDNNVCLLFKTNKLYYVENVDYFVIKAKGVSTETGASYLWWLNGKNDNGAQFAPTSTATETDGTIILEWKISECGNIGENINPVGKSYLLGGEGWTTTFGLTQADALTPVVISYIGYGTKSATAISAAKSHNGEGALKDGKYLIKGEIVIVKNGKLYKANGQLK